MTKKIVRNKKDNLPSVMIGLESYVSPLVNLQKSLRPFSEMQERMASAIAPYVELQKKLDALRLEPEINQFQKAMKELSARQANFQKAIQESMRPLYEFGQKIAALEKRAKLLDETGFLPHESTPYDLIELHLDDAPALKQALENFYADEWPSVRKNIEARINALDIDAGAKAVMKEALDAHEQGYYQSVCRLLFPEIERVVRIEFYQGNIEKRITSQHDLRKMTGDLTPGQALPHGMFGFRIYDRLTDHLYKNVETQEELEKISNDPVPNRHAVIHGLIQYNTMQNSLNTIFMTDYILQIIVFLKSAGHIKAAENQ